MLAVTEGTCPLGQGSTPVLNRLQQLKAASLADATETAGRREESGKENDQPLVHLKQKHRRKLLQVHVTFKRIVDGCNMLHPRGYKTADISQLASESIGIQCVVSE